MHEPTDSELWKFVAEFVGRFSGIRETGTGLLLYNVRSKTDWQPVPEYLESLDAWHSDVWTKFKANKSSTCVWKTELARIIASDIIADRVNASARERCLALWRALDGKLPTEAR